MSANKQHKNQITVASHGSPGWSGPSKIGQDHHMFDTRNLNLWDRLEVNIQVKWIPQTSLCTKVKFELSKEGALVQICTCPFPQHFFKVGVDPWVMSTEIRKTPY